jgi:hypothetical protein
LTEPWRTDNVPTSQTIYVDAPYADACAYLADPASVPAWSPLFRVDDNGRGSGNPSVLHTGSPHTPTAGR